MKVINPLKWFFRVLLVRGLARLGKKGEKRNILVSKCIGHVEPSRVAMMLSKIMAKLKFGVGITP
jgi:hypothetical protein